MSASPLSVIVVGCTPLAAKTVAVVEELDCCSLAGLVNIPVGLAHLKSNYDGLSEWVARRPNDICWTTDINGKDTLAWIGARKPDLLIQAGWSQIFKPEILALPRLYCMGIHPAPLPKGRGGAVINWRIIEGGGLWGNSLFVMQPTVDSGEILDSEPFTIEPRDDIRTAHLKVDRTAMRMLRRTLPKIATGTARGKAQDLSQISKYPRRKPEDGRIKPGDAPSHWDNMIRALTHPYPGAFILTSRGPLVLWRAEPADRPAGALGAGAIIDVSVGRGVLVATGSGGAMWLTRVTPPGDAECWADEWAVENAMKAGDVLAL